MADVLGPVTTLPGSLHKVPEGMKCDECDEPATKRVQGETDSMGCEMIDVCDEHYESIKDEDKMDGPCDWCHKNSDELRPRRDIDEGMDGPVYYVCQACITKDIEKLNEELRYWDERDQEDF